MAKSKEEIVKAYNELKFKLGTSPSMKQFLENTDINRNDLNVNFGSSAFNKMVKECGEQPNKFSSERSELNDILQKYGMLARKLKRIPFVTDWKFEKLHPTPTGIRSTHHLTWRDIEIKFYEYAVNNSAWSDIITLFKKPSPPEGRASVVNTQNPLTDEYKNDFVPPVLNNLIHLSFYDENGIDFEKKVNLLFQMLGFEVESKGQGTGRNPDGIALEPQNNYAIIIDAKARKDGYEIKQEDRKFVEYINTHRERLKKIGAPKLYLVIVSSKFNSPSEMAIKNILKETQVSTTLITAEQLLKVLAYKIEKPRNFDSKKFENLLFEKGQLIDSKIERFIK